MCISWNSWWRCSIARTSKICLDWHQKNDFELNSNIHLRHSCNQNMQNIVTWGQNMRANIEEFVCISIGGLFSGVPPLQLLEPAVATAVLRYAASQRKIWMYTTASKHTGRMIQGTSWFAVPGTLAQLLFISSVYFIEESVNQQSIKRYDHEGVLLQWAIPSQSHWAKPELVSHVRQTPNILNPRLSFYPARISLA